MKSKMLILCLVVLGQCLVQNNKENDFKKLIESFDHIKPPLCYKTNTSHTRYNNKLNKQDAMSYFEISETDLRFALKILTTPCLIYS